MTPLRVTAPAKINWSLEALHIRPDGYHELRSVLQTIDICDTLTLEPAEGIDLALMGHPGVLRDLPPDQNLAVRAAVALREHASVAGGVRITLEKRIPGAAGLGGGSSDAAAALRGCNALWGAGVGDNELGAIASAIGSDVPFFLAGGTAAVAGRGEVVEPLPDARAAPLLLALPEAEDRGRKTEAMFGALTPDDFADGYVTIGVREIVEAGRAVVDGDLNNVFERVTTRMQPGTERAMDALRAQGLVPHLAGAGPSFFLLIADPAKEEAIAARVRELGFEPRRAQLLPRAAAVRIEDA